VHVPGAGWSSGFKMWDLGFRVCVGLRVWDLELRVYGLRGAVWGSVCSVHGARWRVQVLGFKVQV